MWSTMATRRPPYVSRQRKKWVTFWPGPPQRIIVAQEVTETILVYVVHAWCM